MKLLYAGGSGCSEPILKRLLLVGTELPFMDRPSVIFGKWGTVGHQSMFRRIDTKGEPVTISAYAPPSGPASSLYEPYAIADFENPEFAKTVLEGLRRVAGRSIWRLSRGSWGRVAKALNEMLAVWFVKWRYDPYPLGSKRRAF